MEENTQMVPLAALEAESARHAKTLKYLIIAWAVSVIFLCSALMVSVTSEEETVTESTEVSQEADNSGANSFVAGDSYGS